MSKSFIINIFKLFFLSLIVIKVTLFKKERVLEAERDELVIYVHHDITKCTLSVHTILLIIYVHHEITKCTLVCTQC